VTAPDTVSLFWPTGGLSAGIDHRIALDPEFPWIPSTATPVADGERWVLSLPATNTARFFRLAM